MKITKDIINDLLPLYALQECSPDTRTLVDEYLQSHPDEATELRRTLQTALGGTPVHTPPDLGETDALRRVRRELRRRSVLMAFAILFTVAPLSFQFDGGQVTWLFQIAPHSAALFALAAAGLWAGYVVKVRRSQCL